MRPEQEMVCKCSQCDWEKRGPAYVVLAALTDHSKAKHEPELEFVGTWESTYGQQPPEHG